MVNNSGDLVCRAGRKRGSVAGGAGSGSSAIGTSGGGGSDLRRSSLAFAILLEKSCPLSPFFFCQCTCSRSASGCALVGACTWEGGGLVQQACVRQQRREISSADVDYCHVPRLYQHEEMPNLH